MNNSMDINNQVDINNKVDINNQVVINNQVDINNRMDINIDSFKRADKKNTLEIKKYYAQSGEVPLLSFKKLEQLDFVGHCFTTRYGGVSKGIFESMNLSFTRGDDSASVGKNYAVLAEAMGVSLDDFVTTDQTHTTNVMRVTRSQRGMGVTKEKTYADIDGLITNEKGVVLVTFYADCVPLYFVDTANKAIGLSHSGWRGTVNKMGRETIKAMSSEFGTNPNDVIAAIGPSICQSCYEIGSEVAMEFKKEFCGENIDEEILISRGNGKYLLNLWECNKRVLLEAGVREENIVVTNICTCCNNKLLFSHRASQGKRGNLAAIMYLK